MHDSDRARTTLHLVDPELVAGLSLFPAIDLGDGDIAALRQAAPEDAPDLLPECPAGDDVRIETHLAPGLNGAPPVPVIVYRPLGAPAPLPVFLNIHGGGYMFGSARETGPGDLRTAAEIGCLVASVDYRLAPETRAPGAVEDCYAVLQWLYARADEWGLDRERFAVGGQSAGGGLAAALAQLARDRGEIPLCFQLLIYPMLDDRTATRAPAQDNPCTGEFVWTRSSNAVGWRSLLGCEPGAAEVPSYAVPARAADLAGLPPAYITVGMLDLFLEEDIDYARRLMMAGVPTELHVVPGAYHGFEFVAEAFIARQSETERRHALRRAFERQVFP